MVVLLVVVPVTPGDRDPGWTDGPWETDSLDVWFDIVVRGVGVGCFSSVLVGV